MAPATMVLEAFLSCLSLFINKRPDLVIPPFHLLASQGFHCSLAMASLQASLGRGQ